MGDALPLRWNAPLGLARPERRYAGCTLARKSLARNALIIAAALVLSQLSGLARTVLFGARFGTGTEAAAFNAAFRITDFLFNVLAGGALASAFIPMFAGQLARGEANRAWALARAAVLAIFVVMLVLAVLCALLAPWLIAWLFPGFDAARASLAASLLPIMLISTVVFGVSGLLMGVLQSNDAFVPPALAPTFYNLGIVFGVGVLANWFGIHGAALGVALGALLHLAVQVPALLRVLPARQGDIAGETNADLREVLRLMLPRIVGQSAPQINHIVTTSLASRMAVQAIPSLNYAWALMLLPVSAIAQSIATALFPSISGQVARGEVDAYRASLLRALRFVLTFSVPAAVGVIVLGGPLVSLAFERGRFDGDSTAAVAFTLAMYGIGLVAHALYEILARGFFALKDTVRPVAVSLIGVALNIALSITLSRAFEVRGWLPFGGIALANSIATWAEALALFVLIAARIGLGQHLPGLMRSSLTACVAALAMALLVWAVAPALGTGAIGTVLSVALAVAGYALSALALGNPEVRQLSEVVVRRVRRV